MKFITSVLGAFIIGVLLAVNHVVFGHSGRETLTVLGCLTLWGLLTVFNDK